MLRIGLRRARATRHTAHALPVLFRPVTPGGSSCRRNLGSMYDHYGQNTEPDAPNASPSQASRLWDDLTRAAYGIDDPTRPVPPVDGRQLAQVITQHPPERSYFVEIERGLARLAAELKHDASVDAEPVRRRVSELMSSLPQEALRSILGSTGDAAHKRDLLDDAASGFPIDALLRLVLAAAAEAGFEMSRPLVRLLYKLAVQTRVGPPQLRQHAESALRAQVDSLIARWWLVRHNAMTFGFESMFDNAAPGPHADAVQPEADRMVNMAVEVDAVGMPIWGPITQMLADGRFRELLDLLRDAPADSRAARAIVEHVATPQRLSALLAEPEVDFDSVDRLIERMGDGAIVTLLDRLATAESRAVRRGIFDRLVRLGPQVASAAVERLSDKRWFVQRNLLALLGELEYWPEGKPIDEWIRHPDPRLRKEAVRSMLRMPKQRERAIVQSLRDDVDRQTLRLVLAAAQQDTPDAAVPIVVKRLNENQLPPDLKVAAVRLLRNSRSPLALEALLRLVEGGRSLLGRPKFALKSSDMLAALQALAAAWPHEKRASAILDRARASKDADIAAAALGRDDAAGRLDAEAEAEEARP